MEEAYIYNKIWGIVSELGLMLWIFVDTVYYVVNAMSYYNEQLT